MKMKLNIKGASLAMAIAALAMVPTVGHAAWTAGPTATKFVTQQAVSSSKSAVAMGATVSYNLAAGEALAQNDTITITLTGGAVFSATSPTLTPSTGSLGSGTAATVPLSGGAAGSTSALWRVSSTTMAVGQTLTLNSDLGTIFDVTGVAPGNDADIQITLKTSTNLVIGTASQPLSTVVHGTASHPKFPFTGKDLTAVTLDAAVKADTAKVASLFKFFDAAGTKKTGKTTKASVQNDTVGGLKTSDIAAKHVLFTLGGNFSGITSVAGSTKITGDDGTFAGAGTAKSFTINAAKTKAMAVNNALIGAGGLADAAPVFTIDGTTQQLARTFTVQIDIKGDTNWVGHQALAASDIYSIKRDGFSFTTTQTGIGSTNKINIRDTSGTLPAAGAVITLTVTTYNAATGAGTTSSFPLNKKLLSNGQVAVTSATIVASATAAGVTLAPGAANINFAVNTTSGTASVKKQVAGVGLDIGSVNKAGTVLK